jgi:group I intron endonuclease
MGGVYSIVHVDSGNRYIGQTTNLQKRRNNHFSDLRANRHANRHLQSAFNKYGAKAFEFRILEDGLTEDILTAQEQYWYDITVSQGYQAYNHSPITENPFRGQHHTAATKALLSFP